MSSTAVARLLAILWTAGIFAGTLIPTQHLPQADTLTVIDKVAHFVMFAGFGALWMYALRARLPRRMFWVLVVGLLLAVLTEVLQGSLTTTRQANPLDVLANAAGLFTATVLIYLWRARHRQHA